MCDLEYFSHDLHSMEKCLAGVRLSNLGFTSSHYQKYVSSVFTHRHSFKRIPNPITKRISQTSLRHQDPAMPGGQQIRPSRTTIIYLSARQPWITIKCRWRQECKVTFRIVRRSWPTSGKNSLDMQGQCHLFLAVWETLEHTLKLELKNVFCCAQNSSPTRKCPWLDPNWNPNFPFRWCNPTKIRAAFLIGC